MARLSEINLPPLHPPTRPTATYSTTIHHVPPITPDEVAACRRVLVKFDALDLADMLGVGE